MRLNLKFKKWTAVLTTLFFLSAQPVMGQSFIAAEEFQDDDTTQGFMDPDQLTNLTFIQENEVASQSLEPVPTTNEEEEEVSQSILNAFQQEEALEALDGEEATESVLLSSVPLAEIEPVETESTEEETEIAQETTEPVEPEGPQAVAAAETDDSENQTQSEETIQTASLQLESNQTDAGESQTSSEEPSNLTVESLTAEQPILLASLSVVPGAAPQETQLISDESLSSLEDVVIPQEINSGLAMELAAMGLGSSVGAVSAPQSMGVAESALMGSLPEATAAASTSTSSTATVDPPIVFVLGGAPLGDAFLDETGTGGVPAVGSVFAAFQLLFADFNILPDGSALIVSEETGTFTVGDGVADALVLSEFLELLTFIYATFFGVTITVGELAALFTTGTTADGIELFGSAESFLTVLIVSAFALNLSDFFGDNPQGVDSALVDAGAYSLFLPIGIPGYFVTAVGHALSDVALSDEDANLLGLEAIAASLDRFIKAVVTFEAADGFFVVDPDDLSTRRAFQPDGFDFEFNGSIDGFVEFFLTALPESMHESLLPHFRNADGSQRGFAAALTITFDEDFINALGRLLTSMALASLGPLVEFYRTVFDMPTAVGPEVPPIVLPGLISVSLMRQSGLPSALEIFFSVLLSFLVLFKMDPPIPNIYTGDIADNKFGEIADAPYENAFQSFQGLDKQRKKDAKAVKGLFESKTKDKTFSGKRNKLAEKRAVKKIRPSYIKGKGKGPVRGIKPGAKKKTKAATRKRTRTK